MLALTLLPVLLGAIRVSAFNCETHTFTTCADKITHWYDPDDGMICDPLDCGGGRAPAKTDVPCCGNYKGTEPCVTSASYLSCFKDFAQSTLYSSMGEATLTPTASVSPNPQPASSSDENQPTPTESISPSGGASGTPSTTQPPVTTGTLSSTPTGNGTAVVSSGNGTVALSGTASPSPAPTGAANGVRVEALLAIAGAFAALA